MESTDDNQPVPLSTPDDQSLALGDTKNIYNAGDQPIFVIGDNNTININLTPGETAVTVETEESEEEASQGTQQQSQSSRKGEPVPTKTSAQIPPTPQSSSPQCTSSSTLDCSLYDEGYIRVSGESLAEGSFNEAISAAIARGDNTVIDVRDVTEFAIGSSLDTISDFDHYIWVVGDPSNPTKIKAKMPNSTQLLSVDNSGNGFLAFFGIEFMDGYAKGGDAVSGAGGGLGAGGALFLNKGNVIADQTTFTNNTAKGGKSEGLAGSGGNGDGHKGKKG